MTAWESPGEAAVQSLHYTLGIDREVARAAVDDVFDKLAEPDRDMLEAGAAELKMRHGHARHLAAVVWRAMLQKARP